MDRLPGAHQLTCCSRDISPRTCFTSTAKIRTSPRSLRNKAPDVPAGYGFDYINADGLIHELSVATDASRRRAA